jgi:hypothetical protein
MQRTCDLTLAFLLVVSVWSTWSSLSYGPIGLDDKGLLVEFGHASFTRVWGFDHFGHLRPLKNLYFWLLAQQPELVSLFRGLNVSTAVACAWLVRSLCLALGSPALIAANAAALWMLNPTTAVGIVWLSASNHLFALLGMLLYLLLLERAGHWQAAARRGRVLWTLAHAALLFAVLSHELAMLTPLWAALRSWQRTRATHEPAARGRAGPEISTSPRERQASARAFEPRDLAPLLLGAVLVIMVPTMLRLTHTAPELAYRSRLPWLQLMASSAHSLAQNVRLWLWLPGRFGVLLSQTSALDPSICIAAWLGSVCVGFLLWRFSQTHSDERMAIVWVLLFLLPVVNLLPLGVTPVAMHYLILPGVGLAWLAASGFARIGRRFPRRGERLSLLLAQVLILSWLPAFRHSVHAFQGDIALYQTSLANYPDNFEARVNLIAAYTEAGKATQAQELLDQSLALAPEHPALLKHQLIALIRNGRTSEALAWFELHADMVERDADLSLRRALLLRKLGRTGEAEQLFAHVLGISSDPEIRAQAGYQLANLQVQSGRLAQAQSLLRKLHDELPNHPDIKLALTLIDDVLEAKQ